MNINNRTEKRPRVVLKLWPQNGLFLCIASYNKHKTYINLHMLHNCQLDDAWGSCGLNNKYSSEQAKKQTTVPVIHNVKF